MAPASKSVKGAWQATASDLADGVWTVRLEGDGRAPEVEIVHRDRSIEDVERRMDGDALVLSVPLPRQILSIGLHSVHTVDRDGTRLATLNVTAGEPVREDLVEELSLLRDELELLKRAFRGHLSE